MELNYASKAVGTAGLTTGIIGTTLGALNALGGAGNMLGNMAGYGRGFGGYGMGDYGAGYAAARTMDTMAGMAGMAGMAAGANMNRCSENTPATRYDLEYIQKLMTKDQEIAILKSEQNTEIKIAEVYERVMKRVNEDRDHQQAWNAQQMVNNANMSGAIARNAENINDLKESCKAITRLVVPNSAICPGWGQVTVTPQPTGTVVG
ncbi:MAG: hypothetical protein MJ092_07050 [Lachnospiraceae bacterium]|nr:hypothetical protein [Lachnospiraceae bacterium]